MFTSVALRPSIMAQLKSETCADHDVTEAVPFSSAIMQRTLPRQAFIDHLHALHDVHIALENTLAQINDPAVRAVWRDDLAKTPLLERDLQSLDGGFLEPAHPAKMAARQFVEDIQNCVITKSAALLGFLYVLEGSTLGGTILRIQFQAMYDIDETCGLSYYSPYGHAVMPHWQQFKVRMNSVELTHAQQDEIVDAARRAFAHIGAILHAFTSELHTAF